MPTISAVIIAKNEEERIAGAIASVTWANEVIVIDNESTDDTAEIAKKNGAKVVKSSAHNFSELRELGKKSATSTWIIYVDADEIITEDLKKEIQEVIQGSEAYGGYFIKRVNYYLGEKWPTQDQMQRLFRKEKLQSWYGVVHETAKVEGELGTLRNSLIHTTHRSLSSMVEKTNSWSEHEALMRYRAHHPKIVWWRLLRVMMTGFYQSFITEQGWKAGVMGWIESIYQAFSLFITYAKLWELQQNKKIKN